MNIAKAISAKLLLLNVKNKQEEMGKTGWNWEKQEKAGKKQKYSKQQKNTNNQNKRDNT